MNTAVFNWLIDVHYLHFMSRKDFWYRKDLIDNDSVLCIFISDMRKKVRS